MPRVSIILVVRDDADRADETITSVYAQTWLDRELIVVRAAGCDAQWSQLTTMTAPAPRLIDASDSGLGAAIDQAVATARGEFIALLRPAAPWMPDHLKQAVAVLDAAPSVAAVVGDASSGSLLHPSVRQPGHAWLRWLFEADGAQAPHLLLRRQALATCGGCAGSLHERVEQDLLLRLCRTQEIAHAPQADSPQAAPRRAGTIATPPGPDIEALLLLSRFARIDDAAIVLGMFPELSEEGGSTRPHDPRYLLAVAALRAPPAAPRQLFARYTLHRLLDVPESAERLRARYGFTAARLRALDAAALPPAVDVPVARPRRTVLVYSADRPEWACAQIRLLQPLGHWNADFDVVWGVRWDAASKPHIDLDALRTADVVVLQRWFALHASPEALQAIHASGLPLVFETDDHLLALADAHPATQPGSAARSGFEQALRRADLVTVSSEALAQTLRAYNPNVRVLRNLIDARRFRATAPAAPSQVCTIGITGTLEHDADFALLDGALQRVLQRYGERVRIVFMGPLPQRWRDAADPRLRHVEFAYTYADYARQLAGMGLDIALVPLLDSEFNRTKSDIKWLEYSAAGVACVFSDLPPYAGVRDGVTGLKVPNTEQAWFDAMSRLIDDVVLRRAIVDAAAAEVLACRTVETGSEAWRIAYQGLPMRGPRAPQPAPAPAAAAAPAPPPPPWLGATRWLPHERNWAEQTQRAWTARPRIALGVVPGLGDPRPDLFDQAATQWLQGQVLRIAPQPAAPELLRRINEQLLASAADWVGIVESGDLLEPDALFRIAEAIQRNPQWRLLYTDEDTLTPDGQHLNPHCKPDFNLDYLRSLPYVGGLLLIRRDLFETLGGFDPEREGAEDYDLLLRAWEHLQRSGDGEAAIGHVAEVLYHRLTGSGHTRKTVPELLVAGQQALQAHFARLGIPAEVQGGPFPPSYRVRWPLPEARPLVSIIIPTRDQLSMLQRCVESLIEKTRYTAYEILIVDNDSRADDAVRYLDAIESREAELGGRLRVIRAPGEFNFSAMNNTAARIFRHRSMSLYETLKACSSSPPSCSYTLLRTSRQAPVTADRSCTSCARPK